MNHKDKVEKVTKLVNLMAATESENEALQCWRSARAIVPTGKLVDFTQRGVAPELNGELAAAKAELIVLRAREVELRTHNTDLRAHLAKRVTREADLVARLNQSKKEELKLRMLISLKRELANKEQEEVLLGVEGERAEMIAMPRAARERANLIAGIERISASKPEWTDRKIARELKISPSTVGKYRKAPLP